MKTKPLSLLTLACLFILSASCQPAPTPAPTLSPTGTMTPTLTPSPPPTLTPSKTPRILPTSNIPLRLTEWTSNHGIRFVLYLDAPSFSNAVQVLRDGLMDELARSGSLAPGYPKFTDVPVYTSQTCDTHGRFAIQLSAQPDNYFVLPICRRTQMEDTWSIYIYPSNTIPAVFYQEPSAALEIGIHGSRYDTSYSQQELIFQAFFNMGLAMYPDDAPDW